ncbi:type II toxin-antitoxin system RatA family toxin [Rickettsia endosymbiont of Halotydeus destructor]|uniref:type II toxin-antitoxin system RatA family toxin n=1 Tax=Rickettsia endosymbiont of Halotydeus destructor TaxID=2996754 RepID=UPI003BAF9ACB
MPSFNQVKILPYNPAELFYLVLDVESYPKFLPWCAAAKIISKNDEQIIAELVLQVKGFSEKYQSSVTYQILDDERYVINAEAISGPFKYLKNIWQFSPNVKGSLIEFNIDFKMQSIILDKLISTYFAKAAEKMINAFEKRAIEILKVPA